MLKAHIPTSRPIRLFAMDCDGTLTDGGITYIETPTSRIDVAEIGRALTFYSKDFHGLGDLKAAGIKMAIISGNTTSVVTTRAEIMGIEYVTQGDRKPEEKLEALTKMCSLAGIWFDEVAYIGDDAPDILALLAAGLSFAPADASAEALSAAHIVTKLPGGRGAVREACDYILQHNRNMSASK